MQRFTIFLFVLLIVTIIGLNRTVMTQDKRLPTAAVLPFSIGGEITQKEVTPITQWFLSALNSTNKFAILERSKMDAILREQDFTMTDQCNSAECAVQIGQLLAAEKIIQGDIGKIGETYTITIKLIDVTTSRIDKTVKETYKGPKDGLLNVLTVMAQKLAGTYKEKSYTWYYISGAVLAGGGAAAFLLMKKKPTTPGLPFPPNPPPY